MKMLIFVVLFAAASGYALAATPIVVVKEAHCEPQMDDACTVNDQKVPKAQLDKYLPALDADTVSAAGGYCEYPICYSADDQPIGMRKQ
jgi:hypothetical protein